MKTRKFIIISVASAAILIAAVSLYEIHVNQEIVRFVEGRIINHLKGRATAEPEALSGTRIKIISVEKNAYGCKFYKIEGVADVATKTGNHRKRPFKCVVIESSPPPHRFLDFTFTDDGEKILD
ncbi:MAG: hypothetical protein WA666_05985 [Nitrospirota bacterium]